jgi:hypothetical protein
MPKLFDGPSEALCDLSFPIDFQLAQPYDSTEGCSNENDRATNAL